jgi:hypothetical protein
VRIGTVKTCIALFVGVALAATPTDPSAKPLTSRVPARAEGPAWRESLQAFEFESEGRRFLAVKTLITFPYEDKETIGFGKGWGGNGRRFDEKISPLPVPATAAARELEQRTIALIREKGINAFVDLWKANPRKRRRRDLPDAYFEDYRRELLENRHPRAWTVIFEGPDYAKPVATLSFAYPDPRQAKPGIDSLPSADVRRPSVFAHGKHFHLTDDPEALLDSIYLLKQGTLQMATLSVEPGREKELFPMLLLSAVALGKNPTLKPRLVKGQEIIESDWIPVGAGGAEFEVSDPASDYMVVPQTIWGVTWPEMLPYYRDLGFETAQEQAGQLREWIHELTETLALSRVEPDLSEYPGLSASCERKLSYARQKLASLEPFLPPAGSAADSGEDLHVGISVSGLAMMGERAKLKAGYAWFRDAKLRRGVRAEEIVIKLRERRPPKPVNRPSGAHAKEPASGVKIRSL